MKDHPQKISILVAKRYFAGAPVSPKLEQAILDSGEVEAVRVMAQFVRNISIIEQISEINNGKIKRQIILNDYIPVEILKRMLKNAKDSNDEFLIEKIEDAISWRPGNSW